MRNLDLLIPQKEPEKDRWTWATVSGASPLRIRLDGEGAALNITPESLAGDLQPGDRVWTQIHGRRVIVHARSGGTPPVEQIDMTPTGSMTMFAGTAAPAGYLLCQGQEVSQAAYPALYAVIGSIYGGAAAGNFRLPDLRNRLPIGAGTGVFGLGMSENQTDLASRELSQSHRHKHSTPSTVDNAGAHDHGAGQLVTSQAPESDDRSYASGSQFGNIENHTHPISGTTANAGNHNHALPDTNYGSALESGTYEHAYAAINFIIKT